MRDIVNNIDKEKYNKWYTGYINEVDLSSIEWKKFNFNELKAFLYRNYYDEDYESYVVARDINNKFLPFGMTFLTFNEENIYDEYIVGIVKNKLGLYTIVACMIFNSKYLVEYDSIEPVTYIQTIETNKFFQNKGVFKQMVSSLLKFIDINQNILITPECGIGKEIWVISIIKKILLEQGFTGDIRSEYEITEEYLEKLRGSQVKKKVLY